MNCFGAARENALRQPPVVDEQPEARSAEAAGPANVRAFHAACRSGDATEVRGLLSADASLVNKRLGGRRCLARGRTPLAVAIEENKPEVASLLVSHGSDLEARSGGRTPLGDAILCGHTAIAKLLTDSGADVHARSCGITPLSLAAAAGNDELVEVLLDKHAVVDKRSHGRTALHEAAFYNRPGALRILLDRGGWVNALTPTGATALHIAAERGWMEAARVIVGHSSKDLEARWKGRTPLFQAAAFGHPQMVSLLLAAGARADAKVVAPSRWSGVPLEGFTPKMIAARNNHDNVLRLFVQRAAVPVQIARGASPESGAQAEKSETDETVL